MMVTRMHEKARTVIHRRYGLIDLQPLQEFRTTKKRWELWERVSETELARITYWHKNSILGSFE